MKESIGLKGKFQLQHIRNNEVINTIDFNNGITNAGKNKILDVMFNSGTQITAWYIGLIDTSSYSALASNDTISSHSGWIEFTGYSDTTRRQWVSDNAISQSTKNTTPATFNINTTGSITGIFVNSDSAKSGTSGTLWSTATFDSSITVTSGDQIKIIYTVFA
jgi:hypothetical protein